MPEKFVLEMGLDFVEELRCKLRFRFFRSGDTAESSLGLAAPVEVSLREDVLLGAAGSPQEYGRRLAEMVFADPAARVAFAQARAAADRSPLRLRLAIDPGAAWLHNLRWETLYDLDRRAALCADENVYFSRALSSASMQSFSPPSAHRLRALVMIANPTLGKLSPIDVAAELARAQTGLGNMEITSLAEPGCATLDALIGRLHDGCDVLYLVAHGIQSNPARIFFEKPDGSADAVEVDALLERLRGVSRLPLLAVLISCESAGSPTGNPLLALGPRLLAETGIPAVLAMHGQVSFLTIEKFLPVFFKELQRDGQIDRALAVARARVLDLPDWWMPVLFSRLRDNQLVIPPPLAQPLALQRYEPETVFIPAGPFWMGREGENAPGSERPYHKVDLPAYRIGKYPLTNRQFAEFIRQQGMAVNPESGWEGQTPPADRLDDAVIGVTWYQAVEYCRWLSEKTGRTYSLPTEAQWEKAARGVDGGLYPWGNEWPSDASVPRQSPFECMDMVGGIREWTLSLWGRSMGQMEYPYPWDGTGLENRSDPDASELILRVFRGGAASAPGLVTCTTRGGFNPAKTGLKGNRHGFRVVMNLVE